MAEGDGVVYNTFKELVMEGVYTLTTDTVQVTLHTGYTPNIDTHVIWGTAGVSSTEYGTASNYTAGGASLASLTVTMDTTDDEGVFDAADLTWSSLGPLSPATPSHAIVWDTTPTSPADPLMCYFALGTTATNGGDYTLQWATEGIINIS